MDKIIDCDATPQDLRLATIAKAFEDFNSTRTDWNLKLKEINDLVCEKSDYFSDSRFHAKLSMGTTNWNYSNSDGFSPTESEEGYLISLDHLEELIIDMLELNN
jgi:hypothetical protein